jgi:hypothetical protein
LKAEEQGSGGLKNHPQKLLPLLLSSVFQRFVVIAQNLHGLNAEC